jgi:hypothetical protein
MIVDPKTTVGQLVAALPSAEAIVQAYGLSLRLVRNEPLWKALADSHVDMKEFLNALDGIDWSTEYPLKPK